MNIHKEYYCHVQFLQVRAIITEYLSDSEEFAEGGIQVN